VIARAVIARGDSRAVIARAVMALQSARLRSGLGRSM
jgi:hypothetical protein